MGFLLTLLLLLLAAFTQPAPAQAQRGLEIGFLETLYVTPDQGPRWLDEASRLGADVARVNIRWNGITSGQPANPANPGDPAYDFTAHDRAVRGARERGMKVLLTVYGAPRYAEGATRPANAPAGSWKPRPAAVAQFARAVARRYSGTFPGPDGRGPLPQVQYMSSWNEPNIIQYVSPQRQGGRPFGARHYRRMHNAFYDAVKAVNRNVHVVTGATAPFGNPPRRRTRPLQFWREVLCLRRNLRRAGRCPSGQRLRFDSIAHHPIHHPDQPRPSRRPAHRDDLQIGNFGQLRRTLRAAERHNTTGTRGRHGIWAPEIWWQSKPRPEGVARPRQAQLMAQALYLLWQKGASGATFLQLVDSPLDRSLGWQFNYQTGVFTASGQRKPSWQAIRFPFAADRRGQRRIVAWGRAPAAGRVRIQRRNDRGRWVTRARTGRVQPGEVFRQRLRLRGRPVLRAVVGNQRSRLVRARNLR